jgi:hypothetical protein
MRMFFWVDGAANVCQSDKLERTTIFILVGLVRLG